MDGYDISAGHSIGRANSLASFSDDGASFAVGEKSAIEFSLLYAPSETVSGIEVTPLGPNPGRNVELKMNQLEFTLGWKLKL